MNKQEFLNALEGALAGLGEEEIKKSVDFYAEMIDDAVENGENEEEAVARLGSVEETAQKIINETPLSSLVKENIRGHKWSALTVVLLIIGSPIWLSIAASVFAVIISLYISLWAIAVSFFAVCVSLAVAGLAFVVSAPFMAAAVPAKSMLCFGMGLVCMGVSVFIFYLSVIISKLIIRLTVFIIRKIKGIFVRKGGAE